jgi:dihydrofolate reductase
MFRSFLFDGTYQQAYIKKKKTENISSKEKNMNLYEIAAIGRNLELGKNGDMPWGRSLKEDLQFFKKTTLHAPVVMGRKTFESLGRALPQRENIVISRSGFQAENIKTYPSVESFLEEWKDYDGDVFVIGGGSIYKQFLRYCDGLYLSEIDAAFDADTYFPAFEKSEYEREVLYPVQEAGYDYEHVLYSKKK